MYNDNKPSNVFQKVLPELSKYQPPKMNILPKKRWHVRTKENIARVRKDEAKAAEEAKDLEKRIKLADQESRTTFLRKKAQERQLALGDEALELLQRGAKSKEQETSENDGFQGTSANKSLIASTGHVNFFQDLEDGETTTTTNKEREEEEKKEKEDYEKKIGLLTYLGQDSHELTGGKSWWQKIPEKRDIEVNDSTVNSKDEKNRDMLDPLSSVRKYLGCKGVQEIVSNQDNIDRKHNRKKKKRKRTPSTSSNPIENEEYNDKSKKNKRHRKLKDSSSLKSSKRKSSKSKSKKKRKHHKKETHSDSGSEHDKKRRKHENLIRENDRNADKLKVEKLRNERIEREKKARARRNELLYGAAKTDATGAGTSTTTGPERKYNSQFNPQFAKQNKLDASEKYWLQ